LSEEVDWGILTRSPGPLPQAGEEGLNDWSPGALPPRPARTKCKVGMRSFADQ